MAWASSLANLTRDTHGLKQITKAPDSWNKEGCHIATIPLLYVVGHMWYGLGYGVRTHTHPRRDDGIGSQKPEMDYDREVRYYLRHESHKGMRLRSCESPGSAAGSTVEPAPPINYYAKQ